MSHMFNECNSLTIIDLSNFNTQNIIDMSSMFSECKSLTFINFSNFNTQSVRVINEIFSGCYSLIYINLPANFDTEFGRRWGRMGMFNRCNSLIKKY